MSDPKYPVLCLSVALDAVNQARIERFMVEWLALLDQARQERDQARRDAVALWDEKHEPADREPGRVKAYRAALRELREPKEGRGDE